MIILSMILMMNILISSYNFNPNIPSLKIIYFDNSTHIKHRQETEID
jgi:hypothetical protein